MISRTRHCFNFAICKHKFGSLEDNKKLFSIWTIGGTRHCLNLHFVSKWSPQKFPRSALRKPSILRTCFAARQSRCMKSSVSFVMGQMLSEPVTTKESAAVQNHLFKVGSSCMQGWRNTMEDVHCHLLSLPEAPETAFFAVYDGHGGARVAEYAGQHLHRFICETPEFRAGNIVEGLKKGFLNMDQAMLEKEAVSDEVEGSTAICVLIRDNHLYCANVGDSRAVACVHGASHPLSKDHKPNNEEEMKRIVAAGGWVEFDRVNGNLALSRALGDFTFKRNTRVSATEQIIISMPDVVVEKVTPEWEFVIIACDGIWDVMSNEDVVAFVRLKIGEAMEPEKICEELMTRCLAPDRELCGLGCDNMTVVLVCFLHGKPYTNLVTKCGGATAHATGGTVSKKKKEGVAVASN
ncbi:hypothetical protein M8J76_005717 [Diaphorina citri]|nr:hypothetical protein M8J76_005717 [Diaphorina citri]